MKQGNRYGLHRVLEPQGVLPQPAWRLDNSIPIYANEILIDVSILNVDAASFTQLQKKAGGDLHQLGESILSIVKERGKLHNPVTGSGGMLTGTVEAIGSSLEGIVGVTVGDPIASLVSLSLTPLTITRILAIHPDRDQVEVEGKAILFESGIFARLPEDLPQTLSLAVLDVAGAPAQTRSLVRRGDTVLVIGAGGKSGLLCLHAAREVIGEEGVIIGMGHSKNSTQRIQESGLADIILQGDATNALQVYEQVEEVTKGDLAHLTINCVDIPHTEMASILATQDGGRIYFFSMATSFTRAALGAEGIGRDVEMIIGNGYTRGHAQLALQIMRDNHKLRDIFQRLFCSEG